MQQATHTSSKMRFLALMIATLRTLTHDSFSSGLTARNTRLGACKKTLYYVWCTIQRQYVLPVQA